MKRCALAALFVFAACGPGDAPPGRMPPPPTNDKPVLAPLCIDAPKAAAFAGDARCPAPLPAGRDAIDAALMTAGLSRCDVKIGQADLSGFPSAGDEPQRLPDYDALHLGPLRLPGWARESARWLAEGLDGDAPVTRALAVASLRRGHALSGCLDLADYAPSLADKAPLASALSLLIQAHGGAADAGALADALKPVPVQTQQALVPLVGALDRAAAAVRKARGTEDEQVLDFLGTGPERLFLTNLALTDLKVEQIGKVKIAAMADAAAFLAEAVRKARLPSQPAAAFAPIALDTPLGKVVLSGSGDDHYAAADYPDGVALLVDLGGNDTYEIPAGAATRDLPVSVLVDVAGQDQYRYAEHADPADQAPRLPSDGSGRLGGAGRGRTNSRTGRQGSGLLGIGLLFDLGQGADRYRSLALSQGSAVLGVGVLYDEGGDDDYRAEVASQGAAAFGIGLLIDKGGRDAYRSYSFSQGFGYTGGVGALVDGGGDDLYFVDPGDPTVKADPERLDVGGDPLYASAQLPDSGNNSMSQGCGFGRRADGIPDHVFLPGGHGLLYDRGGNDRYLASVFAQGSGYYRGIGVLYDGAGDDVYEGLWYVQGAAAHVSIGVLLDEKGSDRYNPTFPIRATSIGTSNDFSVGLHADLGGDDQYKAPGLSLGSGYAQGLGILINAGGNDSYTAAGYPALGGATISGEFPFTIPRAGALTLGLFVDAGGSDSYAVPDVKDHALGAGNDKSWSFAEIKHAHPMDKVPDSEKSAGLDDGSGSAVLP